MLPNSHLAPINPRSALRSVDGAISAQVHDLQSLAEIRRAQKDDREEAEHQARSAELLAGEFSEFISAATQLESSYRALQKEVSALGLELSERNAALKVSLAENERMRLALEQIVDSMPCGVLVLDRKGKVTMINSESKRLLGLGDSSLADTSATTLRQISQRTGINLEAAGGEAGQEFCLRDANGMRWIEARNRQLFNGVGRSQEPDQTILILRDISARKRAEDEREAARKTTALAELSTVLAHEIRNPLASLELFAELIEKDSESRGEWISNLRAGIRSLSGTVNNVLSFHGSGSLPLAPLGLAGAIDRALQFARPLADQASVSLEWNAGGAPAIVMGNESALRQVVLNLVSNAIRHTPAGGRVTVSLRSEMAEGRGTAIVEFSDTGCGIRADQIDHIFEPGFSGNGDSSGLGLAVCERLMMQHGGRIAVANRVPSGARFELFFPELSMESATA